MATGARRSHHKWELRACGRRGHETYAPTGEADGPLAARLRVETPAGEAWRCLRCGDFVVGPPRSRGPADEAPQVLRGKALRDATILRLLAVERAVRGLVLIAVAIAIERFRTEQNAFQQLLERDLPAFRDLGTRLGVDVDGSAIVRTARHVATIRGTTLDIVALLVAIYAAVELVEAVGLWLLKRWGEYFTVVATAAFLPLEIRELTERITVTRVAALVINVAAVVYLIATKRLFGARGGRARYDHERRVSSLLEVEHAAAATT